MTAVALTLSEAADILEPRVSERQLRDLVRALGLQPVGYRQTGKRGHPVATYDAGALMRIHGALVPFLQRGA